MTPPAPGADPQVVARLRRAGCVFAEQEALLLSAEAGSADDLERLLSRREGGLPLEQVLGWASFCGLRIRVEPGVFVPRPRTEFMVRQAVRLARPGAVVLDLGCGSGAIATAVAASVPDCEVHATDVSPAAVHCARHNLGGTRAFVYQGDLYDPLPHTLRGRVQLILANLPYVPTALIDEMPREARLFEPTLALDGGQDGLEVVRRVVGAAARWLAPDGHLLVETSREQAPLAAAACAGVGLSARVLRSTRLAATIVIASPPGA
ncbi:MAG: putative protein N(5)-glutamine methyltransferase [Candidatus Dormibacteria bacterium]